MIEVEVYNYLKGKLTGITVLMEIPKEIPDKFVLIERTGGTRKNYIDTSAFRLRSFATSMYDACVLNEDVKEAMDDFIENPNVSSSKLNTDYNYTDTTAKRYCYQSVYEVVHFFRR